MAERKVSGKSATVLELHRVQRYQFHTKKSGVDWCRRRRAVK
jgi:hypothetical protein